MLPLLAPVVAVVATAWSSVGAVITAVGVYIVAKLTAKAFILTSQIVVSLLLIGSHIIMLGFFLYAIAFVYNKYNEFLELISNMSTESEALSILVNVFQAVGFFDAFNFVFSIFSPFIIAYLLYRVGLVVFHSFQMTSNELFKIGVLTQQ